MAPRRESRRELMLEVTDLRKVYGSGPDATEAVRGVTFTVEDGEFVCLVGPSGCGKTTLLKCMSGLMLPSGGEVRLAGTRVTQPPREMALVFQDYSRSLLPWMNVLTNVTFPLAHRGVGKKERTDVGLDALAAVGLTGFAHRHPWQLSGGMQQRVAIARAVAYRPQVMLLDEPFASVDAQTRADLEDLIRRVHHDYGVTILFVTHDVDEAVYLANRVVVLSPRPSVVEEILPVPLPDARDQVETKALPEFAQLRSHLFSLVKRRDGAPAA
jgi:NitT/TauT family transport system ATP-binding protein